MGTIANNPSLVLEFSESMIEEIDEDGRTILSVTITDPDPSADLPEVTDADGNPVLDENENPVHALKLEVVSDNSTLLPDGAGDTNILIMGNGTSSSLRTVTLSPAPDQHGEAVITLTVSDGIDENTHRFKLKVNSVNDEPSFDMGSNLSIAEDPVGTGFTTQAEQKNKRKKKQ